LAGAGEEVTAGGLHGAPSRRRGIRWC
jgi:hypothetical protein